MKNKKLVSATITEEQLRLKKLLSKNHINFSGKVGQLIEELAKLHNIK